MTNVSFEGARHIAANYSGEPIATYGWENDTVYVLAIDYTGRDMPLGDGVLVVDKATGQLHDVTGLLGHEPAPNLRPINNPPE